MYIYIYIYIYSLAARKKFVLKHKIICRVEDATRLLDRSTELYHVFVQRLVKISSEGVMLF